MLDNLNNQRDDIEQVRKIALPNSVAPSLVQDPVLPGSEAWIQIGARRSWGAAPSVAQIGASNEEQVAFATVRQLGALLRAKKA